MDIRQEVDPATTKTRLGRVVEGGLSGARVGLTSYASFGRGNAAGLPLWREVHCLGAR